jgi:hypothetical protein
MEGDRSERKKGGEMREGIRRELANLVSPPDPVP